jgi:hypothetical protein
LQESDIPATHGPQSFVYSLKGPSKILGLLENLLDGGAFSLNYSGYYHNTPTHVVVFSPNEMDGSHSSLTSKTCQIKLGETIMRQAGYLYKNAKVRAPAYND